MVAIGSVAPAFARGGGHGGRAGGHGGGHGGHSGGHHSGGHHSVSHHGGYRVGYGGYGGYGGYYGGYGGYYGGYGSSYGYSYPGSASCTTAAPRYTWTNQTYEPGDGFRYPLAIHNPVTRSYFYYPWRGS